jgi:hypothetical protein
MQLVSRRSDDFRRGGYRSLILQINLNYGERLERAEEYNIPSTVLNNGLI